MLGARLRPDGRIGRFFGFRLSCNTTTGCRGILYNNRTDAVAASMWFLACGSKVLPIFCGSFFRSQSEKTNHTKQEKYRSAAGYDGIQYATA